MLTRYLTALAQTKQLPLRGRIVCLLAAAGADGEDVGISDEDLRRTLALGSRRRLREELDALAAARMVTRATGRGRAPTRYRLRPPEDWIEPRWVDERKAALLRVALFEVLIPGRKEPLQPRDSGLKGRFVDKGNSGLQNRAEAALQPRDSGLLRESNSPGIRGCYDAASAVALYSSEVPSELPSLPANEGTKGASLSSEGKRLVAAFERGLGRVVFGDFPARLGAIADSANGSLGRLLELAERPDVKSPVVKLEALERALLEGAPAHSPVICAACSRLNDTSPCSAHDCPWLEGR